MPTKHSKKSQSGSGSKPKHKLNIHTHNPKTGKPHSPKKAHKIKQIADKGKEKALILLFLPFMLPAELFLRRKGITPAKAPRERLIQVFNETKKKSFGLVDAPKDAFDYGYTEGEFGLIDDLGFTENEYGFIPVTPAMITTVIAFLKTIFDKIKEKKAKGETLTKEEQEVADMAPQIEKDLAEVKEKAAAVDAQAQAEAEKEAEKGEGGITIGGIHLSMPILMGILLLIVLLFFFMRK